MRPGLRSVSAIVLGAALAASAVSPAVADARWLACRFTDPKATVRNFHMVFDDIRNTAALFEAGSLVQGTGTSITFQSLRTRFPTFTVPVADKALHREGAGVPLRAGRQGAGRGQGNRRGAL